MKLVLKICLGLVLILAVVIGLNWGKIQRLHAVNTFFDAGKIVQNFSNAGAAFHTHELNVTAPPHMWPKTAAPLPDTVEIGADTYPLSGFLAETSTTAFLVVKNGTIVSEAYYRDTGPDDLRISWSMAKSFMAILFGHAVEDGLIKNLNDPVDRYVPALKDSAYAGVPIRHVLNMSSGVKFDESYLDPKSDINKMGRVIALGGSMDAFAASLKDVQYPSGTARQYVSIDTHVLAMVLRTVTGKSLHRLFEETYGAKLGIGKTPYYLTDGKDVAFALGGLNMRTRDYGLFGQMILQKGQWRGEQIVPARWIADSTRHSAPEPDLKASGVGYGYQWWVPYDSTDHGADFFAVGVYGQYIYINPAANMVIVKNSAHREFLENGQSGMDYKRETIDMFRSLTRHYAPLTTP